MPCFCLSLTFQGGQLIFGGLYFSVTRWTRLWSDGDQITGIKPGLFFGATAGIDTATPREMTQSNWEIGGGVADGLGGSGGLGNGSGTIRPYGGVTSGAGWQAVAGETSSWDVKTPWLGHGIGCSYGRVRIGGARWIICGSGPPLAVRHIDTADHRRLAGGLRPRRVGFGYLQDSSPAFSESRPDGSPSEVRYGRYGLSASSGRKWRTG